MQQCDAVRLRLRYETNKNISNSQQPDLAQLEYDKS